VSFDHLEGLRANLIILVHEGQGDSPQLHLLLLLELLYPILDRLQLQLLLRKTRCQLGSIKRMTH
jgi:hypothetical protein